MDKKIINMFPGRKVIQNEGEKYSELLKELIKPFEKDLSKLQEPYEMIAFGQHAWNLGNLSQLMSEEENAYMLKEFPFPFRKKETAILRKMIELKKKDYAMYDRFIADFDLEDEADGQFTLTVFTVDHESYVTDNLNKANDFDFDEDKFDEDEFDEDDFEESDYEEGFINRTAIIIKPLQPYYEWIKSISSDIHATADMEPMIYLVDEDMDDLDGWLKKNSEKLFKMQLEGWTPNKKQWPQKRSFKMFREWFQAEMVTMVYDMECEPVNKEL